MPQKPIAKTNTPLPSQQAYSLKLSTETIEQMKASTDLYITIDDSISFLQLDNQSVPLNYCKESQTVQLFEEDAGTLKVSCPVLGKLSTKPQLGKDKKAEIRRETELAEKRKQSRRMVTLDDHPVAPLVRRTQNHSTGTIGLSNRKRPQKTIAKSRLIIMPSTGYESTSTPTISSKESQKSWSPPIQPNARFSLDSQQKNTKTVTNSSSQMSTPSRKRTAEHFSLTGPLEDRFSKLYQTYSNLSLWLDDRLQIFSKLDDQLVNGDIDQGLFRFKVEDKRLAGDLEYKQKLEELEECCAQLMMIKARRSKVSGE